MDTCSEKKFKKKVLNPLCLLKILSVISATFLFFHMGPRIFEHYFILFSNKPISVQNIPARLVRKQKFLHTQNVYPFAF